MYPSSHSNSCSSKIPAAAGSPGGPPGRVPSPVAAGQSPGRGTGGPEGRRAGQRPARWLSTAIGMLAAALLAAATAGCSPVTPGATGGPGPAPAAGSGSGPGSAAGGGSGPGPAGGGAGCAPASETLAGTPATSLIAVIPRTSAEAATWGLRELAGLLPYLARAGLQLHVFYTQDGDDLTEDGGDGGPPQVLQLSAPSFPAFTATGAPPAPAQPTTLTEELYCQRLGAWQARAAAEVKAEAARRASAAAAWATSTAARLMGIASRPIPDTEGAESGVEFEAGPSIFAAAQVAATAPRPTILFLGGLTEVSPPSQRFPVPARLVALIRSTDPAQVLAAEQAWSRWVSQAGGTFRAVSAYSSPAVIASTLTS